ncbi:hypothetical protein EB796_011573 [Bugula neritina]|uniref:Uncharacterized protein n=1 Tax=Bugula neritina TaxID=10212 RepID=A0A7J7JW07_BUGNE|nr:hypothetical protein EB796_011573 [Bugula neritina]
MAKAVRARFVLVYSASTINTVSVATAFCPTSLSRISPDSNSGIMPEAPGVSASHFRVSTGTAYVLYSAVEVVMNIRTVPS